MIAWLSLITLTFAMPVDTEKGCVIHKGSPVLGEIVKTEGRAKVFIGPDDLGQRSKEGMKLRAGYKIITYKDSNVILRLEDNSSVILNENAELSFVDVQSLKQETGEVYYQIEKRAESKGLKIQTPFSIIGIKGTEFIVDANKTEIALNEGRIAIASLRAEFELHKQEVMQEYEKYKQKQMDGFKAYKARAENEIVSYVKEFDLEHGKVLYFTDADKCEKDCENHVSEEALSDNLKERFKIYKDML
jgi:hypothetical protein